MPIYIIEPKVTDSEYTNIIIFNNTLVNRLMEYGVSVFQVNKKNIVRITNEISSDSLVITYNEHEFLLDESFEHRFLEKAIGMGIDIWPIAMDRKFRLPKGVISHKQSYDVWEQLRCRDLKDDYVSTIAKIFARKIISRVFPTCYSETGEIFISHRRLDGEEIAAKMYDTMIIQAKESTPFRDVVNVKVGEEAQTVIDKEMENSDVFIFIHTPESANSEWILKELKFALLRCIPIVWIQIDEADIGQLKVFPSEKPHLHYKADEFLTEKRLAEIVDEILQKSFDLIMERSDKAIEYIEPIREMFGENIQTFDETKMIYHVSVERKGYHYPQRNIEQYIQLFGRTPITKDIENLVNDLKEKEKDSIAILTNRIVSYAIRNSVSFDTIDDFYYHWKRFKYGKKESGEMEIVLSGAFPDGDEAYKQSLTDALIIFEKVIIKSGYKLTFGAHPTLQELFFEVSKEVESIDYRSFVNMYISRFFFEKSSDNDIKEMQYRDNCTLYITDKKKDRNESLTEMRKAMIQRENVKALVCLGGKIKPNKLEEGIREEIQLATEFGIPVFIVGSVGGCAGVVAVEYEKNGWERINSASDELNQKFLGDPDYFSLAQEMINFLNK